MPNSETQRKATALAKELIDQLGRSGRTDTFGRWVAYYLGEQMTLANEAAGAAKAVAEERCFHAILALWSHRNSLPDGLRPFEGFEPILRALAKLDPDAHRSAYLAEFGPSRTTGGATEVETLAEMAISIDRAARIVIDFVLSEAAGKVTSAEVKTMLENALPTSLKGDIDSIHEITRRRELLEKGGDLQADENERRRERIAQLDKFCDLCKVIRKTLAGPTPKKRSPRGQKPTGIDEP